MGASEDDVDAPAEGGEQQSDTPKPSPAKNKDDDTDTPPHPEPEAAVVAVAPSHNKQTNVDPSEASAGAASAARDETTDTADSDVATGTTGAVLNATNGGEAGLGARPDDAARSADAPVEDDTPATAPKVTTESTVEAAASVPAPRAAAGGAGGQKEGEEVEALRSENDHLRRILAARDAELRLLREALTKLKAVVAAVPSTPAPSGGGVPGQGTTTPGQKKRGRGRPPGSKKAKVATAKKAKVEAAGGEAKVEAEAEATGDGGGTAAASAVASSGDGGDCEDDRKDPLTTPTSAATGTGTGTTPASAPATLGYTVLPNERTKHAAVWRQRYNELIDFKIEHGHMNIPKDWKANPTLAHWVEKQRHRKRHFDAGNGQGGHMTKERIEALTRVGFNWNPGRHRRDDLWEQRFRELIEYKREFGDCNVSEKYERNKALGKWVGNQRHRKKLLDAGKPSRGMNKERKEKLDAVGFEWVRKK